MPWVYAGGGIGVYRTALGGVDIIKDDELLANPSYCPVVDRTKAYIEVHRRAYEETGHRAAYFPNVTDRIPDIFENAKRVVELGADGIIVNFMFTGLDVLAALAADPDISVPILAHLHGSRHGDRVPRIGDRFRAAPWKARPPHGHRSRAVQHALRRLSLLALQVRDPQRGAPKAVGRPTPTLSAVGGGVTPTTVPTLMSELGNDIVIGAGGVIQGHPMGPKAGVQAMTAAIEAALETRLEEKALECEPLRLADRPVAKSVSANAVRPVDFQTRRRVEQ